MIEINIAQALENYANSISDGYQTHLAYGGKTDSVVEGDLVVLYDAVNLIKRQQAEIERLTINMNAFGLGMRREA